MKLIYKYLVPLIENAKIEVPVGAEIISVEVDQNELYAYAIIDVLQKRRTFYHFKIISNNQHFESVFGFKYRGTVRIKSGVLHVFEKE